MGIAVVRPDVIDRPGLSREREAVGCWRMAVILRAGRPDGQSQTRAEAV